LYALFYRPVAVTEKLSPALLPPPPPHPATVETAKPITIANVDKNLNLISKPFSTVYLLILGFLTTI
jgi:hypothetical protein